MVSLRAALSKTVQIGPNGNWQENYKQRSTSSENHNLQIAMRHVSNLALKIISQKPKKFLCNQNVILWFFSCQHIFLHKYLNNCHHEMSREITLHSPQTIYGFFNCKILKRSIWLCKKEIEKLFSQKGLLTFPSGNNFKSTAQAPLVNSRLSVHRAVIGLLNSESCIGTLF